MKLVVTVHDLDDTGRADVESPEDCEDLPLTAEIIYTTASRACRIAMVWEPKQESQ